MLHMKISGVSLAAALSLILLLSASGNHILAAGSPSIIGSECEGLTNPLGLDISNPSFSWKFKSEKGNLRQVAYQLLVASTVAKLDSNNADIWNTGKQISDQSAWTKYDGKKLASRSKYYWKVIAWVMGEPTAIVSQTAYFTTGILDIAEWKAKWIGLDTSYSWDDPTFVYSKLSARYFRKSFALTKKIRTANLYFTGLGLYELYFNGKRIGPQVLAPTPSDYRKRVYYNVFDVKNNLNSGKNTVGVTLGNGYFFSMRPGEVNVWKEGIPSIHNFGYPKLLFQLEIEYTDGSKELVLSDESWKVTADGPIRTNNGYDGETYDLNKTIPGWNLNDYNDSRWSKVDLTAEPGGKLFSQPNPNMKVMKVFRPLTVKKIAGQRFLVDIGQNIVGWVALRTKTIANKPVILRFAERLKDGTDSLYTDNLRSAKVTDTMITTASPQQISWQPSFVYHGFRYVEISGVESLNASDIDGMMVYDDMATTGSFKTSDTLLNKIYDAAYWTISGNYKGMPVDCPQRDERMGWLGDRSINSVGESFLFDNYHVYAKWLDDIADAQLPNGSIPDVAPSYWWPFLSDNMTWPSSYLFVSDMLYKQYGSKAAIEKHYDGMKMWMNYMKTFFNKDSLLDRDNYGDWCVPPEAMDIIFSKDSTRHAPKDFIASAYYVYCSSMMARFAGIIGKIEDSTAYADFAGRMKDRVNAKFLNKKEGYYANNTITSNLFALSFGLAPADYRDAVADNIVKVSDTKFNGHLGTGLVGNQWLMRGLTDNGYADKAFKIATNKTYPSWGYMIENGATTIWELWNGNTANPAMNSGNHVMLLGDLLIWYYEKLAGIKSIEPGFKKIEMNPYIENSLNFVDAEHVSSYGAIRSNWSKTNGKFNWRISIPANTSAVVYLPASGIDKIKESGKQIGAKAKLIGEKAGRFVFELGSGDYHFETNTTGN
ncbi:MAG: alpha-rhamnosidase [Chitinophagaceae bacterium]|nr:MAG: alpha-rhamnosidase [Chitinophagaceae bacterium]